MASKKIALFLFLYLFLLVVPSGVLAQYVPGKKSGSGVVLEYKKVTSDSLQVRKSKLEPGKKKACASTVQPKTSYPVKGGYAPSSSPQSGRVVMKAGEVPIVVGDDTNGGVGKGVLSLSSKSVKGGVVKKRKALFPKVDSVRYEPRTYRLGERVIMQGDSGKDVRSVANILVKKLYFDEDSIIYTKDGGVMYDGDLVRAVKHFQEFNGLYPDGIIGKEVIKVLRKRK